jgi:putative ABC transport system ATP-binding protein
MTDRNGTADALADAGSTVDSDTDPSAGTDADSDANADPDPDIKAEAETAVELRGVRRTYHLGEPVHALAGVSLAIPSGSYTAVMGPSGSGKSTLMNLVGCLDTPSGGIVKVGGEDVAALSEDGKATLRGEQVGFVFQTFNLMPRLTASENVALPMVFRDRSREERIERAKHLLTQVGLGDRLDHQPTELSGGQRQRVAIARALANDPEIILADEPTGNLDTDTGGEILGLFEELHDAGNTILLVTHERPVAEHADRIVHLRDGRIESVEAIEHPRRTSGTATAADTATAIDTDTQVEAEAGSGSTDGWNTADSTASENGDDGGDGIEDGTGNGAGGTEAGNGEGTFVFDAESKHATDDSERADSEPDTCGGR